VRHGRFRPVVEPGPVSVGRRGPRFAGDQLIRFKPVSKAKDRSAEGGQSYGHGPGPPAPCRWPLPGGWSHHPFREEGWLTPGLMELSGRGGRLR